MILAETTNCKIAAETAKKLESFTCTTGATNLPDIWMAVAGVVTALATIMLAIFAYRAWISTKAQIGQIKRESKAAEDRSRRELEAAEERSRRELEAAEERSRQEIIATENLETGRSRDSALFEYLGAHADLLAASADPDMSIPVHSAELRKASLRFIMLYAFPGKSGEITKFDDLLIVVAEHCRLHMKESPGSSEGVDLASVMKDGFNIVDYAVRDLFDERIEPLEFRERLVESYRWILGEWWPLLDAKYVATAIERNWIDEPLHWNRPK